MRSKILKMIAGITDKLGPLEVEAKSDPAATAMDMYRRKRDAFEEAITVQGRTLPTLDALQELACSLVLMGIMILQKEEEDI